MDYIDKNGDLHKNYSSQDKLLKLIYGNIGGRLLIKPFTYPIFSKGVRLFLTSPLSKPLVTKVIRKNKMDLSHYKVSKYSNYNSFFTREINPVYRPVCQETNSISSPSDGFLSIYEILEDSSFKIKGSNYTFNELVNNLVDNRDYLGGTMVMLRLTVDNYHRYSYPISGYKTKTQYLKGILHTVNPIACDYYPIYKKNARTLTIIQNKDFGDIIQMEVGALCVGKIVNYHDAGEVIKGQEKGRFEFGGSTILLIFKKNQVQLENRFFENSKNGYETLVHLGEKLGTLQRINA